jgi:diguanylate cyclase (GGDEF)-like protein/PAS domain S-box-containing protein
MPSIKTGSLRTPLATWLFLGVLGATIAAVLSSTLIIDSFVRDEARKQASLYLQTSADGLRDALDRGMAQHYEEIRVIGQLDQVARSGDALAARRALDQVRSSFPQFAWLGLTDRQGKVLAAADGLLEGVDVSARPWWSGAQHAAFVGDVHSALLLAKLLPAQPEPWRFVDIAVPVRGADGEVHGVLGAHLSWDWAAQIKRELVDKVLAQHQAEALVLSADGTVLLGPADVLGRKLEELRGHLVVQAKTRGAGRYPGLGWNVVLRQPEVVALAEFHALQMRTQFAAAALCALFAPLLWLLARRLARPLWDLTARLEGAASPALAPRSPLYREAEVLGDALSRYAQRHAEDADALRELNATLEKRVAERTAALERSEQQLRDIADNVPALIAYFDADEHCRFANAQAQKIHGIAPERLQQTTLREALGARYGEYLPHIREALGGQRTSFDGTVQMGRRPVDFQTHFVPDTGADGRVAGFYILAYDQTALKAAERESAAGAQRLKTIADNLPVMIAYIDKDERYQFSNATYKTWLGVEPSQMIGRTVAEMLPAEDYRPRQGPIRRALGGTRVDFETESRPLGVPRHLHTTYLPDVGADGAVAGIYALVTDVSDMRATERQQAALARTDALTGLPNRHCLNEKLAEALARCRRSGHPIALLFLDIDRFKSINDSLGHAAGDEVLKTFARRLAASVRETDTVARLAGDEFIIVLESLHTAAEPQFVARKILSAIARPFELPGTQLQVGTSIGIAFHDDGSLEPAELMARADNALYDAKAAGRNTFRMAELAPAAA